MRFLEFVFVFGAELHDGAHVHFVKGGEHGRGILRFDQSPGDRLAQIAHLFLRLVAAEKCLAAGALCRD